MTLSQDQIDFYWKNGYLPYGKVLSDEAIELLRHEYDCEFEKARQTNDAATPPATRQRRAFTIHRMQHLQL